MYQNRNNQLKIISLFRGDYHARFYLREISKLLKIPLKTCQNVLAFLEKIKVLKSKTEGKNKYFSLNLENIKTKLYLDYYLNKSLKGIPNISIKDLKKISNKSLESNIATHYIKRNIVAFYFLNLVSAVILLIINRNIFKKYATLKENLKKCNISSIVPKLTGTECSIERIKDYITNYNIRTFRLIGMFAHKWIGKKSNTDEFEHFLVNLRNKHGKEFKVRFLLTSPVAVSVEDEFKECGLYKDGSTKQFFKTCLYDYKFLLKMEKKFPKSFQCRVSDSPPIFRYRQVGNSIFVSDYCLAKDLGKGDDRPHIEFSDVEKDSEARRCLYHAFEGLFRFKWDEAEFLEKFIQRMTDKGHM